MAHIVVARLTDAQFTQLQQTGIAFREIPAALIDRIQAMDPTKTVDEIMERAIKATLGNYEAGVYERLQQETARMAGITRRRELNEELGL